MRSRCCQGDDGGSHYHCASCGEPSGMLGHSGPRGPTTFCKPEQEREAWWANHVDTSETPEGAHG